MAYHVEVISTEGICMKTLITREGGLVVLKGGPGRIYEVCNCSKHTPKFFNSL
jgi:hypothetical protein